MLKQIFDFFHKTVDFLFPYYCVGCRQTGNLLCERCKDKIIFRPEVVEDDLVSLFTYENKIIKDLLWRLKYKNSLAVVDVLGPYLADYLMGEYEEEMAMDLGKEKWVVAPAPIFWRRKNERGYNQAEKLAKFVADSYPDCFELQSDWVRKIKNTKPQVKCKSRSERLENLAGAFEARLPAGEVRRQIVIIDDVSTTGTTIMEIKKVLKKAGARNIKGVVIAHG